MSEINPPLYLEAGEHPSNLDRLFHADLVTAGIIASAHLEVTEQATPALGVTVAAGRALVAGDEASDQGLYYVRNDAAKDVALATADATNDRIDLIVARVKDSFYSGVDDEWALEAVTGTPAASPVAPAAPSNSLILAEVTVPADAGGNPAITDAEITDKRVEAALRSAIVPVPEPLDVAEVTSGTQASLTLTIPSGVTACRIVGQARTDDVNTFRSLFATFNGVFTASAYILHQTLFDATSLSAVAVNVVDQMTAGEIATADYSSGIFSSHVMDIPTVSGSGKRALHFQSTAVKTSSVARTRNGAAYRQALGVALTTVELFPQSGSFVAGTRFELRPA